MRTLFLLLLMLLGACSAGGGSCRLEKLAEVPVVVRGNVPVVTVEINGQPAQMVIDTGSNTTVLTRTAARRLGLVEGTDRRVVRGAGGALLGASATTTSARLGSAQLDLPRVLLTDAPAPPLDGLLGIDALIAFEVELDVPHRQLGLYRARSCATAAPPWPAVALPVQQQAGSGHLFVPVLLNNQPLRGMLDSGASLTTLSLQAAGEQGLTAQLLSRVPGMRGQAVNAGGFVARGVIFERMQIGADVFEHPPLLVGDLPAFAGDMLVGDDYLGSRRLWISFLLGRVFVAPPG